MDERGKACWLHDKKDVVEMTERVVEEQQFLEKEEEMMTETVTVVEQQFLEKEVLGITETVVEQQFVVKEEVLEMTETVVEKRSVDKEERVKVTKDQVLENEDLVTNFKVKDNTNTEEQVADGEEVCVDMALTKSKTHTMHCPICNHNIKKVVLRKKRTTDDDQVEVVITWFIRRLVWFLYTSQVTTLVSLFIRVYTASATVINNDVLLRKTLSFTKKVFLLIYTASVINTVLLKRTRSFIAKTYEKIVTTKVFLWVRDATITVINSMLLRRIRHFITETLERVVTKKVDVIKKQMIDVVITQSERIRTWTNNLVTAVLHGIKTRSFFIGLISVVILYCAYSSTVHYEGLKIIVYRRPSPSTVDYPSPGPSTVVNPSPGPSTVIHPSLSPSTVIHPSLSPNAVFHPSLTGVVHPYPSPDVVLHPSPNEVVPPGPSPIAVLHPSPSPDAVVHPSPNGVDYPSLSPHVVVHPRPNPSAVVHPNPDNADPTPNQAGNNNANFAELALPDLDTEGKLRTFLEISEQERTFKLPEQVEGTGSRDTSMSGSFINLDDIDKYSSEDQVEKSTPAAAKFSMPNLRSKSSRKRKADEILDPATLDSEFAKTIEHLSKCYKEKASAFNDMCKLSITIKNALDKNTAELAKSKKENKELQAYILKITAEADAKTEEITQELTAKIKRDAVVAIFEARMKMVAEASNNGLDTSFWPVDTWASKLARAKGEAPEVAAAPMIPKAIGTSPADPVDGNMDTLASVSEVLLGVSGVEDTNTLGKEGK